jgi:hypothetical protein
MNCAGGHTNHSAKYNRHDFSLNSAINSSAELFSMMAKVKKKVPMVAGEQISWSMITCKKVPIALA